MICKSKKKYIPKTKSLKKKGGAQQQERNISNLLSIIRDYFKQKNVILDNDNDVKEYISKITNKQFEEMKINKIEKQKLRNFNKHKGDILIAKNLYYVSNLLNDIEKKFNESEFLKNIEQNKEKLLEELKLSKSLDEEINQQKLNLMKDVKKYHNMKKLEITKKKELDEIQKFSNHYSTYINYFSDLLTNLKEEIIVRNEELEKMTDLLKKQEESKNISKELFESYKNKKLYIAQLEQDIKIFEKTTDFLTDHVNKKLEDSCICDREDVDCQEWLEANKYKNE
jgi:hypothetical protein